MDIDTRGILLSKQRITKSLIRLRGCAADLRLCYSHMTNRFSHDVVQAKKKVRPTDPL